MSVKEEIRNQIVGALANASFPIATPDALIAAMPNGADTTGKSGYVDVKASDAGKLLTSADFPFRSAEHVADTIANRAGLPD